MDGKKSVLVVARGKKVEALRMASGLTLLDDRVEVAVLGELARDAAVTEQLEALEFADVPLVYLDEHAAAGLSELAQRMRAADAVFVL